MHDDDFFTLDTVNSFKDKGFALRANAILTPEMAEMLKIYYI